MSSYARLMAQLKDLGLNLVPTGLPAGVTAGGRMLRGTGTPEGAVTGSPGDLYVNLSGGAATTLYVKETGAETDTGWAAK